MCCTSSEAFDWSKAEKPAPILCVQSRFPLLTVWRVNCLAALSKCSNLRRLDLSFVSESISMADLLRSTSLLPKLESLHLRTYFRRLSSSQVQTMGLVTCLKNVISVDTFQGSNVPLGTNMLTPKSSKARSSAHDTNRDSLMCKWPATLRELHISGGIHDEPLASLSSLPPSLSSLSIGNCPHLSILSIGRILQIKGPQLHHLEIVAPIPALTQDHKPLSGYMEYVPNLVYLKISLDFVSRSVLLSENDKEDQYSLRQLDLDCFDPEETDLFTAYDVWAAIAYDRGFGRVRKVRVHRRLGWVATDEGLEQVKELDLLLKALAREDGDDAEIKEADAGVVLFGKR